jgi:hypothetical protein
MKMIAPERVEFKGMGGEHGPQSDGAAIPWSRLCCPGYGCRGEWSLVLQPGDRSSRLGWFNNRVGFFVK